MLFAFKNDGEIIGNMKQAWREANSEVEAELKKREGELAQSNQSLEEEQEAGQKKDRNIKDLNNKIHDLEEELEVGLGEFYLMPKETDLCWICRS